MRAKNGRRYRYYVSSRLVRGLRDETRAGWRLPAPELERTVLAAARSMLGNRTRIASILNDADAPVPEIQQTLVAADKYHQRLSTGAQLATTVANLVSRVTLTKDGMEVSLNLQPLLPDNARIQDSKRLILTEFIPLQMKRRGVETKLVVENQSKNVTRTDPALLRAVARGHRWFAELAAGTAGSTIEIAKREGVNDSYVRRLIPLAFLSPAIIEAICAGRQPLDLSAEKLRRAAPLPLEWREQQRRLGLE
jgi:site-specific DNA recombinase